MAFNQVYCIEILKNEAQPFFAQDAKLPAPVKI
jgi:hypothetical protein